MKVVGICVVAILFFSLASAANYREFPLGDCTGLPAKVESVTVKQFISRLTKKVHERYVRYSVEVSTDTMYLLWSYWSVAIRPFDIHVDVVLFIPIFVRAHKLSGASN